MSRACLSRGGWVGPSLRPLVLRSSGICEWRAGSGSIYTALYLYVARARRETGLACQPRPTDTGNDHNTLVKIQMPSVLLLGLAVCYADGSHGSHGSRRLSSVRRQAAAVTAGDFALFAGGFTHGMQMSICPICPLVLREMQHNLVKLDARYSPMVGEGMRSANGWGGGRGG